MCHKTGSSLLICYRSPTRNVEQLLLYPTNTWSQAGQPPDRYADSDLAFIIPHVLEFTYTAHDFAPQAQNLGYYDPPFAFDPDWCAWLLAELDANYPRFRRLDSR